MIGPTSGGLMTEKVRRRFGIVLWFALLVPACCWRQVSGEDLGFLHLQSWSTEEGLPQSSVHSILQSRDGYIWVATEGGVARFDGVAFQTFRHATTPAMLSDDVCCLAEDAAGALWFGTSDGLVRLRSGVFQRFGEADGLPSAAIVSLGVMTDGSLLVTTGSGAVVWKDEHFHTLIEASSAPLKITALAPAKDGGAWLVSGARLAHLRGGVSTPMLCGAKRDLSLTKEIVEGQDGSVWLRSGSEITVCSGAGRREWKVGRELPGARVESLAIDRGGTVWIGTNDGLVTLAARSLALDRVAALQGNTILQTLEDREGNIWIGTETSGLHVLRQLTFRVEAPLANQAFTGIVQASDGAIWAGTRQDGLRRWRKGMVDEPAPSRKLTSPIVLALAPGDRGSVWAGTPDGLNHVEADGSVRHFTAADGLPDDFIRSIASSKDGLGQATQNSSIWAGTRHGLAHLEGSHITTLTKADGLGSDLIGALFWRDGDARGRDGSGDLWAGTSGGLSRIEAGGKITNYTSKDGLPGEIVTAMTADRHGSLWIAMRNGDLSRFAAGRFQSIRDMPDAGEITGIAADANDFLWLRATRGIERVSLKSLGECANHSAAACSLSVARYGVADGLPSEEIVPGGSPALLNTGEGELWLTTRRGIAIADTKHVPSNTIAPLVALQRFMVDDSSVDLNEPTKRIPFGHARFTIEYAGLTYAVPSKVRYRFILQGFDQTWTEAGNRRSATYTNLPPRDYTFRVQAMNNDGIWSEPGAELHFLIVPPFYRRPWFWLLLVFGSIGIFALLYQLRLRRLRGQFEAVLGERNRMAREIHDTLAQDFVGVSIQLDIVSQLLLAAKVEAALQQVKQTRKLVTQGLAEARRSIWELRANTAQDSLPTLLAKVVERYTTEGVAMQLHIGGTYRPIGAKIEGEVLRVAQEALSNVQRHARATEVSIHLQYGDMLVLAVEDNGCGFLPEQTPLENSQTEARGRYTTEGHYGLQGMHERAAVLGARLEITSEPGEGSKVTLTMPAAAAER